MLGRGSSAHRSLRLVTHVWRPRDWPLAVKLAVLFALSWSVLATVLTVMGVVESEQALRDQAERALASDGQQVATSIDDWHIMHVKAVLTLAKTPAIQKVMADSGQPEVVTRVVDDDLQTATSTYSDTGSFGLMGLDGLFRFSSDDGDFDNTTGGQRDFFREALVRDSYISGVQGSADSTDLGRIYYSAPVRDVTGRVVGVVRARTLLSGVQAILDAAKDRIGDGATGVLVDEQGLVIASTVDPGSVLRPAVDLPGDVASALVKAKRFGGGAPPPALNDPELAVVVGVPTSTTFTWHVNNASYAAVAVPLHQTRWTYVAALPIATLEAPVRQYVRNAVMTAVLGLLLTSVVAYLFARPIVAAITALTAAARGLARGELDQEVRVSSKDELGQMARAFRSMVSYQQTMARLADAVAAGDLSTDVAPKSSADRLGIALRAMLGNLRELVKQLEELAYRDALTNLPNRAFFTKSLDVVLESAKADRSELALLFLDLDNFKFVNDTLGHATGDRLLVEVARRLEVCMTGIEGTVARLGGDEFTVIMQNLASPDEAAALADCIADALAKPVRIERHQVDVSASIGIAVRSYQQTAGELLTAADLALYAAKAAGKARWMAFDPEMADAAMDRLALESELRRALQNDEFEVHYQPLVQLDDGRVTELEALVRWRHPQRGLMAPAQFISLAEETGLIVPLGQWVLDTACREARRWQAAQPRGETPLVISVNLSALQLQSPTLVDSVRETLERTGLDPSTLKLEITESVAVADTEANRATLSALRSLGVHLVIDDFGTGNSALNYLRTFPIDGLKIDRSFVSDICQDGRTTAMVRAMIGFAKVLGLSVVGEGIETAEQAAMLRTLGCERGQGYLFARPVSAEQIDALLADGHRESLPRAA